MAGLPSICVMMSLTNGAAANLAKSPLVPSSCSLPSGVERLPLWTDDPAIYLCCGIQPVRRERSASVWVHIDKDGHSAAVDTPTTERQSPLRSFASVSSTGIWGAVDRKHFSRRQRFPGPRAEETLLLYVH